MPRLPLSSLCVVVSLGLLACGPAAEVDGTQLGEAKSALAHAGPWEIPANTLAVGDTQFVEYTGAGPWLGESGCSGGIMPGTDILRDYLYAHFPQTTSIGGYACRPIVGNESQMSVHATGRALDVMIPLDSGEADNDLGDPIGNWLIENAQAIGIQYIIWDLYTWGAERDPGAKGKPYGGTHPHHDHLHIELAVARQDETANWFENDVDAPTIDGCTPLLFQGGIVEETDECFTAFGPAQYWRHEDAGHDGSLLWTNAFDSSSPSNWARWNLIFSARGRYEIEVYVDPAWGVHSATRYAVRHAEGQETIVTIDQSSAQGWVSLGEFDFDAGGDQHVSVYDDVNGSVAADQHIAVDALRATRVGVYNSPVPPDFGDTHDDGDTAGAPEDGDWSRSGADDGGCSVTATGSSRTSWRWAVLVAGLGAWISRRRRGR